MNELDGKVAVVTGAARGQGRATARCLVGAGARVVAGDLLVDELRAVDAELGDAVLTAELDIRERAAWLSVLEQAERAFGRIDILVNNAGVLRMTRIEDETAEGFEALWRINCLGAFLGIQAVIPHLRRVGGGAIVNSLSTVAMSAWTHHGAYGSSKWALRGLTKVAALELARDGIRVNAVVPGVIATPMILPNDTPEARQRLNGAPLGRLGEPEDIAEAVLYLVSERAGYVTGAELVIDGGFITGTVLG